jgi:hypothetical protein
VWHHHKQDFYTVKSGCWVLSCVFEWTNYPVVSYVVRVSVWKAILKMKGAPKFKLFIWRAIRNLLPCQANLLNNQMCQVSNIKVGTCACVLFFHPRANDAWFASNVGYVS